MRRWIDEQLRAGETLLGTFVETPSLAVCEVLARCGYDVLVADAEHAPLSPTDVQTIVAGADVAGRPALVRLAGDDPSQIQHALDAGAAGVVVPRVHTAEQTASVIASATYPPLGHRGAGPGRASVYGLDRQAAVEEARAHTLIAVQIESAEAVRNIDAILAVDGLGMAFVGPNDLSLSLGRPPEDEFRRVIDDILGRAEARGVLTGILAATAELAQRYREAGVSLILTGTDLGLLAAGARSAVAGGSAAQAEGSARVAGGPAAG